MSEEYLGSSDAIVQMVDNMLVNQDTDWVQGIKEHMPPAQFKHEMQTVRISLPRRSGHSTAAVELWKKYKTVTIFPKHDWMMTFMRDLRVVNRSDFQSHRCFAATGRDSIDQFGRQMNGLRMKPELLVFDGASRLGYGGSRPPWIEIHEELWQMWNGGQVAFNDIADFVKAQYTYSLTWEDWVEQMTFQAVARLSTFRGFVILQ